MADMREAGLRVKAGRQRRRAYDRKGWFYQWIGLFLAAVGGCVIGLVLILGGVWLLPNLFGRINHPPEAMGATMARAMETLRFEHTAGLYENEEYGVRLSYPSSLNLDANQPGEKQALRLMLHSGTQSPTARDYLYFGKDLEANLSLIQLMPSIMDIWGEPIEEGTMELLGGNALWYDYQANLAGKTVRLRMVVRQGEGWSLCAVHTLPNQLSDDWKDSLSDFEAILKSIQYAPAAAGEVAP